MDLRPKIRVFLPGETSADGLQTSVAWEWTITRMNEDCADWFETTFDNVTYTYSMNELKAIVDLIAKDHVRRFYGDKLLTIESNLGFKPYSTKGGSVHKHLQHTIHLFQHVVKIRGPPEILGNYAC